MSEVEVYQQPAGMLSPVTDSWTAVVNNVADLAGQISGTEFVPSSLRGSTPKVAAAILTGRELGLAPMTSLSAIHVINGKPGISAEMMRGLVLQAGHQIVVAESSSQRVVIRGRRQGAEEWSTVEWTDADARRAGLTGGNYAKYPRQMLAARATTELCRLLFADVIHGLRSVEELEGMGEEESPVVAAAPAAPAGGGSRTVSRRRAKVQAVDQEQAGASQEQQSAGAGGARRSPALTRRGGPAEPDRAREEPAADADGVVQGEVVVHDEPQAERRPEPAPDPAEDQGEDEPPPPPKMTGPQNRMLHAVLAEYEVGDDQRHEVLTLLVGRLVESASDLTKAEAKRALDMLNACDDGEDFRRRLQQLDRGGEQRPEHRPEMNSRFD